MKRVAPVLFPVLVLFLLLATAPTVWAQAGGYEPTPMEQYMVELVNRARADPDVEAAFFEIDLNEGLPPGTLPSGARQPLAINTVLTKTARDHTQDIVDNIGDLPPDHASSDGTTFSQRMAGTGLPYTAASENSAWTSQGGKVLKQKTTDRMHLLLFKDFTKSFEVVGRGHRKNLLNGARNVVGLGIVHGRIRGMMAGVCTQDFMTINESYITGVVFSDWKVADNFYTPEEGFWGVTVTAVQTGGKGISADYQTTTFDSGGYSLPVSPGTYTVTAAGGGLPTPIVVPGVVVSGENVKVDFSPAQTMIPPPVPQMGLRAGAVKAGKTGGWTFAGKKGIFSPGGWGFTLAEADSLQVTLDGIAYFLPGDRATSKVKYGLNKVTGEVVKISVTDANKNKLKIDLKKKTFKMSLKNAPGFDPTDGSILLAILWSGGTGTVELPVTIVGAKGVVGKATGEVVLID